MTTTTTNKPVTAISQPIKDCCICGDLGLSYLLFRCQVCQFRYQHKYCSNEYPAAKYYRLCNWCISERDESSQKTMNSSSSTKRSTNTNVDDYARIKRKNNGGNHNVVSVKKLPTKPIIVKKTPPEEGSPTLASRKRITTVSGRGSGGSGGVNNKEGKLRRTESEKVGIRGIVRKQVTPIVRNKMRRYKSLEDVSC